jgi:hypothetical protein
VFFQELRVVDGTTLVQRPVAVHGALLRQAHGRRTSRKLHGSALRQGGRLAKVDRARRTRLIT